MEFALVLIGLALAVSLYFNIFGKPGTAAPTLSSGTPKATSDSPARKDLEVKAEKKNKDYESLKLQMNELKDELRAAKKKLHEQRESEKDGRDLKKAREEAERSASMQLEAVRVELATALAEVERMKSERGGGERRPRPAPVAQVEAQSEAPSQQAAVAAPPPEPRREREPVQRVIRELSADDKEKMVRLETEARTARGKLAELEKEARRFKGRLETQNRTFVVTRSELDLVKDKYRALEKRLNRTLLERDLTRRAIKDLEKKTGVLAERTELTNEELSASDRSVDEKQAKEAAEDKARETERVAKEKAAENTASAPPASAEPANGAAAEATGAQTTSNSPKPS